MKEKHDWASVTARAALLATMSLAEAAWEGELSWWWVPLPIASVFVAISLYYAARVWWALARHWVRQWRANRRHQALMAELQRRIDGGQP